MDFTKFGLNQVGFNGFYRVSDLWKHGYHMIPAQHGIYAILRDSNEPPEFLTISTGGWSKGKDPTVAIEVLEQRWVDNTNVLYWEGWWERPGQ